ncbi:phage terminase large subunit family protein [Salmonella enterica]|nr:phage terminase large subunit family protein [Salmonella enterica]
MHKRITEVSRLTAGQREAVKDRSLFHVVVAGEMSGKTTLGIDSLIPAILGGGHCVWIAATGYEMQRSRGRIRDLLDDWVHKTTQTQISFINGAVIEFWDWQNLPRMNATDLAALVMDDVHLMPGFGEFWSQYGRDLIRQNNGGEALFTGCACGRNSDFYRLYAQGGERFGWSSGLLPTLANAPHLELSLIEAIGETPESERLQRFECVFHDYAIQLTTDHRVLKPGETFLQWCERLAGDGLLVDGKPFRLDDRPAMRFIYEQIPSSIAQGAKKTVVLMKGAQLGFTVTEMLATLYLGLRFPGSSIGLYMPDMQLSNLKSKQRFVPITRSVPAINRLISEGEDGDGNVRTRRVGSSIFHFLFTSGKGATESMPMDAISLDEVQNMTPEQIEKTGERLSASALRFTLAGSTANLPGSDIHWMYQQGTEHRFHTECPHCLNAEPMDEAFPANCVRQESGSYQYVCTKCGGEILNPQRGEWRATHPERGEGESPVISIHFPQFLSPTISPSDIGRSYHESRSKKSFYNRKLGKPWMDEDSTPVTMAAMAVCAAAGDTLGVRWETQSDGRSAYYLGIDQMYGLNAHIVKKRLASGHLAIVFIELFYGDKPFNRSRELIEAFKVKACVVELNPNSNDAKALAQDYPGRVFAVTSYNATDDLVVWNDRPRANASDRRTSDEFALPWTVKINQYGCMSHSLSMFTGSSPKCVIPGNYRELTAERKTRSGLEKCEAANELFYHLSRTALVVDRDEITTKVKYTVQKVGIDPHLAFANHLCDVATARDHAQTSFIMPDEFDDQILMPDEDWLTLRPGEVILPTVDPVTSMIAEARAAQYPVDSCGACRYCQRNGETHFCGADPQHFTVRPTDYHCQFFSRK